MSCISVNLSNGASDRVLSQNSEYWFDYPVTVQPHHTDYAGVVWHGSYIAWLEEARIEALSKVGIEFANLVEMGCDLPVIHLSLNYRKFVKMGDRVRVRTRLERLEKVRFIWTQNICALETEQCFVTGQVVAVAVDRDNGRILRSFSPLLHAAIARLTKPSRPCT
jgi:acyl-CoA thioester hydrolase